MVEGKIYLELISQIINLSLISHPVAKLWPYLKASPPVLYLDFTIHPALTQTFCTIYNIMYTLV